MKPTVTLFTALLLAPLGALHAAEMPKPAAAISVVEVKDPSALTSLVRFQPYRHVIPDRRDPKTGNSVRQVSFLPGYNRAQYYHFEASSPAGRSLVYSHLGSSNLASTLTYLRYDLDTRVTVPLTTTGYANSGIVAGNYLYYVERKQIGGPYTLLNRVHLADCGVEQLYDSGTQCLNLHAVSKGGTYLILSQVKQNGPPPVKDIFFYIPSTKTQLTLFTDVVEDVNHDIQHFFFSPTGENVFTYYDRNKGINFGEQVGLKEFHPATRTFRTWTTERVAGMFGYIHPFFLADGSLAADAIVANQAAVTVFNPGTGSALKAVRTIRLARDQWQVHFNTGASASEVVGDGYLGDPNSPRENSESFGSPFVQLLTLSETSATARKLAGVYGLYRAQGALLFEPQARLLADKKTVSWQDGTDFESNSSRILNVFVLHANSESLTAAAQQEGTLDAGVASVDITPTGPVVLAGSPYFPKSASVSTRLYVKALVLASGPQRVAIVALDTLKYPVECVVPARRQVEKITGIPASNVIICSSHTHSGPLWSYYPDQLVTPIAEAVAMAARDLTPCRLGTARGKAEGLGECRRVIKDGQAWNRWPLPPSERDKYPAEGPADPEFDVLAVTGKDGRYKAIVYNFACHAANNCEKSISADYPGDVQEHVQRRLGYAVPALYLTGACGDVNPIYSVSKEDFGERLSGEIIRCLGQLEFIVKPFLAVESREMQMPGRENPQLREADIALKWPQRAEVYKEVFHQMKEIEKPSYPFFFTGIRIGDDFAIATNPVELFCEIGLSIKNQSPFRHTMVAEQTNGAHGYVPTAKAFAGGSYETWFGEHSYLTTRAGEIIEKETLDILNSLKRAKPTP